MTAPTIPAIKITINEEHARKYVSEHVRSDPTAYAIWCDRVIREAQHDISQLHPDDAYVHSDVIEIIPLLTPREVVYRFLKLPYTRKWDILARLDIPPNLDPTINDLEAVRQALEQVRVQGKYEALHDIIAKETSKSS